LVAGASALAAAPPATAPTSAGPGLPTPAFSSIGPALTSSHTPSPDPADKDDVVLDNAAVRLLARTIPSVRLKNLGLTDALGYIRDLTDLTISVNWDALGEVGIKPDDTITINLKSATIGNILDAIIAQSQNGRQVVDYEIQHGVLTIDTVANLDKIVVSRRYEVSTQLAATTLPADLSEVAILSAQETVQGNALAADLRAHVMPDTWNRPGEKNSGPNLGVEATTLTVVANLRTQRAVLDYLDKLKPSQPSP
jgi:hypothetical protein